MSHYSPSTENSTNRCTRAADSKSGLGKLEIARAAILFVAAILIASVTSAANFTWDSSGANPAAPVDGSGTWNTTTADWSNGTTDTAWSSGNTAVIGDGDTAGTITLAATLIQVGGITFNPVSSGSYTITGNTLTLGGTGPDVFTMNTSATIASVIASSGSPGLTVAGTGTLTLSGPDTYSGTTTINSGATLQLGNGVSGGAGSISGSTGGIVDNGILSIDRTNGAPTITPLVSGSGSLINFGSGSTLTLNNVMTYTGSTTINAGTLTFSVGGNVSSSSALNMGGGVSGTATLLVPTGRGASSSIVFNGTTFNYGNDVASLPASLGTGNTVGLGAVSRNAGSFVNFGTLPTTGSLTTITQNTGGILGAYFIPTGGPDGNWAVSAGDGTNAGAISALGSYSAFGTANGNDSGQGTIASPLVINSMKITGNAVINVNAALTITTGGILIGNVGAVAQGFAGTGSITSGGPDLVVILTSQAGTPFSIGVPITGSIGYTQAVVSGALNTQFNAANTFSGDTNIDSGTVFITNSAALQNSTLNYNNQGGTLNFGTTGTPLTAATLGGLKGSQNLTVQNSSAANVSVALSIGNNNQSTTYSGVLTNSGSLIKVGATGTLTLTGANAITGGTTVSGGTLKLSGSGSLGSSTPITVNSGAVFDVSGTTSGGLALSGSQTIAGTGTVTGALSLPSGANISPGVNAATPTNVGTLTTGNLSLASGAILNTYFGTPGTGSPGTSGLIQVNGNLTLPSSGLTINLLNNNNANSNGSIEAGMYDIMNYTGTLNQAVTASTFTVGTTGGLAGRTYTFSSTGSSNGQIDLVIGAAPVSLTWTGAAGTVSNSSWDTLGAANNWANGTSAAAYANPNAVTFNDNSALTGTPQIANSIITIQTGGVMPATVTFNNSAVNYTLSNNGGDTVGIAGATGITKLATSTGTVFLQSANTFTGPVAINAGIINISNGNALGTVGGQSGVTVASGAALQMQGGITTNAQPLSLNGTGVASSGALDNVSGANTYAGPITLAAASTITSAGGSLALTGGINNGGVGLTLNGSGNLSVNTGAISGNGALTYSGSGILTLIGTNTYTGGTTLSGGVVNINGDAALGASGNLTFSGNSTLQAGAATISLAASRGLSIGSLVTATFDTAGGGNTLTIPGAISGASAAGLTKINPGTLILTGANSYGGITQVTGGTLRMGTTSALSAGGVTLSGTTPTLQIQPAATVLASGFGGASHTGWTLEQGQDATGPSVSSGNVLTLTSTTGFNNNAAWSNAAVSYANGFTASFVYQVTNPTGSGNGATFTLTNAANVTNTGGTGVVGGFGTNLGYTSGGQANNLVTPSAALGWNTSATSMIGPGTGIGANAPTFGTFTATGGSPSTVNLASGHPILFTITSTGGASNILSYTVQDETTGSSYSSSVNLGVGNTLTALLGGGGSAHVGFTGGSTADIVTQTISNFSDTSAFTGIFSAANNVTISANSTIDVSYNGGASMGTLAIGGSTLNFTNQSGGGATLSLGATSLSGNPTFAPATGVNVTLGALADGGGTARTITIAGSGTGAITLGTAASSLITGTVVNITGGALNSNNASALGSLAAVNVASGATFRVGASQTVGSLGDNGSVTVNGTSVLLNGNTLTVGSSNSLSSTFSGVIGDGSGSGNLIKAGTGTLQLAGTNTYSGATTVNGGILRITGSLGASAVTVGGSGASGTPSLGGSGTINGPVTIMGTGVVGHLAPSAGLTPTGTNLTIANALTINSGGVMDFNLSQMIGGSNDLVTISGTGNNVNFGGSVTLNVDAYAGTLAADNYVLITDPSGTIIGPTSSTINQTGDTGHQYEFFQPNPQTLDLKVIVPTPIIPQITITPPANTRVIVGQSPSISGTYGNTGANNMTGASLSDSGFALTTSNFNPSGTFTVAPGTTNNQFSMNVAATGSGVQSYGVTLSDGTNMASAVGSLDVIAQRVITNGAATNLGVLHNGATVSMTSNAFTTSGTHLTTTDVQVAQNPASGSPDANGISLTGSAATQFTGSTPSDTRSFGGTVTIANASAGGAISGSFNLVATTLESGGPLPGETAYPNVAVGYVATVYSGKMIWNGATDTSWSTATNWSDSVTNGAEAAPGLDPNFTTGDTATFGAASSPTAVNLNGANPSLNAITFNGNGSYTIAQGSAGSITLAGATPTITATGAQVISAPVILAANSAISVTNLADTLNMSGAISGNFALTVQGSGTLSLFGANSYTGGTTINGGTTRINSAASLGATAGVATINNATLEATASITTSRNFQLGSANSAISVDSGSVYEIDGTVNNGASTGTLNSVGQGTLIVTANNGYSGGTNISAGTLRAGAVNALGGGGVNLSGTNPTLQLKPAPTIGASGFGGASHTGWVLNNAGQGSNASVSSGNVLTLTTGDSLNQNRTAWQTAPVTYNNPFTASFVFQGGTNADGMAFVLENSSAGTAALGGIGGALGYTNGGQNGAAPNNNSVALGWNTFNASTIQGGQADPTATNTLALWNGATATSPVNLASGDPILFTVTGQGSSNMLNFTLKDQTTLSTFSGSVALTNTLSNILGGTTAIVGFTGSTSAGSQLQTISNFLYTSAYSGLFSPSNNVTISANSTIDVSYNGGASMGTLAIGGSTLNFTNQSGGGATLSLGATSLSGNPTFAPATGVNVTLGALADGGGTARTITIAGSGTGAITLGTAASSLINGTVVNITGGALNSNNATALGSLAAVNVASGATFTVGASQTVGSLGDNGSLIVNGASVLLNGNALTVGSTNNLSSTFSGVIADGSGSGSLIKAGTGMLTLAGASTYTGGTTLSGGTLRAANAGGSATGTGAVMLGGGTLASGPVGTISGAVNAGGAAHNIAPGGLNSIGTLTLGSTLSINGNSTLHFDLNGASDDLLAVTGAVSIASGTPTITFDSVSNLVFGNTYTLATFASSSLTSASFAATNVPAGFKLQVDPTDLLLVPNGHSTLALPASTLALNMHVNDTGTPGVSSVTNTFTDPGHFTASSTGADSLNLNPSTSTLVGANSSVPLNAGWANTATAGARNGQISITNNDNAADNMSNPLHMQAVSGGVYNLAAANSIGTINVGAVHQGGTATQALTLTNTAPPDPTYTETLTSSGFSGTSTGFTATGTVTTPLTAGGASDTTDLVVGLGSTLLPGPQSGTTTLAVASNAVNGSALGATPLASQTVTIVGQVYSGQAQWNIAGGGNWSTQNNWSDTQSSVQVGAPGISGFFGDTALFASTPATITLDTSPVLAGMTFNTPVNTGYSIAPTGSNRITLNTNGNGAASVAVTAGSHTISAPVTVTAGVNVTGAGVLTLSGVGNSFTGPIGVGTGTDSPKLVLNGGSTATASVATGVTATVAVGATLELDGTAPALVDSAHLTNPAYRAAVVNSGSLVVGANAVQQVGGLDGDGDGHARQRCRV